MRDVAKKGDRALILPPSTITSDRFTGCVVTCVSDPIVKPFITAEGEYYKDTAVNEIEPIVVGGFKISVCCTHRLLPLRGDPDAQTWTTEQGWKVDA